MEVDRIFPWLGGRALPESPHLATGSERTVWAALRSQLLPGEVLLSSVRFSDARGGDVEADFIILIPGLGAAVVEVKGGTVSFENGQWFTRSDSSQRRIHPIDQARRAKHALRRSLDRQPEWSHPLLRSEFFLAFPLTDVDGDLGPEARRELVFDRGDVDSMMGRIRAELASTLNTDFVPALEDVETALTLLMRTLSPTAPERDGDNAGDLDTVDDRFSVKRMWPALLATVVFSAGVGFFATRFLNVSGIIVVGLQSLLGTMAAWWLFTRKGRSVRDLVPVIGVCALGLGLGVALVGFTSPNRVEPGVFNGNYSPCIPTQVDVNCSDLRTRVNVIGEDIYGLDGDGDGIGCETLPQPQ